MTSRSSRPLTTRLALDGVVSQPPVIAQDFDDTDADSPPWERFLNDEDEKTLGQLCGAPQSHRILSRRPRNLHFQPICPNVSVQPELRPSIIDELQDDLRSLVARVGSVFKCCSSHVKVLAASSLHLIRYGDDAKFAALQRQKGNGHHV